MRTKFVLFCWGRKTSATEYELQNAPLNTFSSSKTLQVKWNKNTRTDALNPLNLYLTLNLNDSRTEINHCSHKHKQVSDSLLKINSRPKKNQRRRLESSGENASWRAADVFGHPIRRCLPWTQPETRQHLQLPVVKQPDRLVQLFTDVYRQQLFDSITVTPEIPKIL